MEETVLMLRKLVAEQTREVEALRRLLVVKDHTVKTYQDLVKVHEERIRVYGETFDNMFLTKDEIEDDSVTF